MIRTIIISVIATVIAYLIIDRVFKKECNCNE
jgi:hypothetical protein